MEKKPSHPRRGLLVALIVFLSLFVALPLLLVGISFIGRVHPSSAIAEGYTLALRVPRSGETLEALVAHETVGEILADPSLSPVVPLVTGLRDSSFPGKGLVMAALNGELDAATYPDGSWVAAFDTGILSTALRALPALSARVTVPNLYYVQSGRLSRFEYRYPKGKPLYIGTYRNLLVASDSPARFEEILSGAVKASELGTHGFARKDFNAGLLVDPALVTASLPKDDPLLGPLARSLSWGGYVEVTVGIERSRLDVFLSAGVDSSLEAVRALLSRESSVPALLSRLPSSTQYESLLSAGPLKGLFDAYAALDPKAVGALDRADRAARLIFGAGLDDLVFSWAGPDVAAFGLEGRPKPVFAVKITDEDARKRAFDRIISSVAVSEDDSTVLDGYRISRIRLPDFLTGLLSLFSVRLPAPYWIVDDGYLLASESPETLLAAVSANRKGDTLAGNETWRALAGQDSSRVSASVYYSVDRSVPFFLKGSGPVQRILGLYTRGCLSVRWGSGTLELNLTAIPGQGGGIAEIPGFPLAPGLPKAAEAAAGNDGGTGGEAATDAAGNAGAAGSGKPGAATRVPSLGKLVDAIRFSKKGGLRILCVEDLNAIAAWDPVSGDWSVYRAGKEIYFALDPSLEPETPADPALWSVTSDGEVALLDGTLRPVDGFPVLAGARPTAAPVAFDGVLYLAAPDSSMKTVDRQGAVNALSMPFTDPLRSPPAILRDGKSVTLAMYPKSFFSQVWLTDALGAPRAGWPQSVSGIAYGSPVAFGEGDGLRVAFVTQAGDLYLFDGSGATRPGFPARLEGVFYAQPVWDGAYLWALSADGTLWRVNPAGEILSQAIPDFTAENAYLRAVDVDGDGSAEIFATGDGNALYGYSSSFSLLSGFPLPAWGTPWFGDLNGDGTVDCLAPSMDNAIGGWQFRKERTK